MKYLFIPLFILGLSAFTHEVAQVDAIRKMNNHAFTYGEELNYRLHYGWINAATVKISVAPKPVDIKGRSTYNITAYGRTNRSFDWAFKVRDHFETYLDSQSMAPLKYFKSVQEDNYKDIDLVYYDHEKKWLTGKKKSMEIPAYVQDVVSALFYARTIDFSSAYPGKVYPLDIYLDQTIYQLQFKFLGTEMLKTDIGKVNCIKLRPQLVVDRVFKDEDDMTIWVSNDANKIPIRVQADIWVGSIKADIVSHKGLRNKFASLK